MAQISFQVQGSQPEPYHVVFSKEGNILRASCTCPAGHMHQYCKHRFNILDGDKDKIVSGNAAEVDIVCGWLPGSNVEAALRELGKAEIAAEAAKQAVSAAKRRVAEAL